jgi:hypothetical protein
MPGGRVPGCLVACVSLVLPSRYGCMYRYKITLIFFILIFISSEFHIVKNKNGLMILVYNAYLDWIYKIYYDFRYRIFIFSMRLD